MSSDKLVIFICTGNTCRSPMAEGFAVASKSEMRLTAAFKSRGINVVFPVRANDKAIDVLKLNYGVNISGHIARQLNEADVEEAALLVTMTHSQKTFVRAAYPEHEHKVYTIREIIGTSGDIKDPYGLDIFEYKRCSDEIKTCVDALITKITNREIEI